MDETKPEYPSGRPHKKPAPFVPRAMPDSYGLNPNEKYDTRELAAIVKRLVKTKNPDMRAFFDSLTPDEILRVCEMPEFEAIFTALAVRAMDGTERVTKGQWASVLFFYKRGVDKRNKREKQAPQDDEPTTVETEAMA